MSAVEKPTQAEEERDALLAALGWRTGPFRDALSRKVILDDSAALRPEMVKARNAAADAQAARDNYRYILGEFVHDSRSGVLARMWEALKVERKRRLAADQAARTTTTEGEGEAVIAAISHSVFINETGDPDFPNDQEVFVDGHEKAADAVIAILASPPATPAGGGESLRYALQYARNLIGPDEIIDAALSLSSDAAPAREAGE